MHNEKRLVVFKDICNRVNTGIDEKVIEKYKRIPFDINNIYKDREIYYDMSRYVIDYDWIEDYVCNLGEI